MKDPAIPLVSVIVPVYDAAATLARAVESVLAQDFRRFELILSDDGSRDGSGDQCDRYAAADARVRVIHTANAGPSAARNRALEICRGEFLFFLDADDRLAPHALSALVRSQRSNDADVVVGDFSKCIDQRRIESGHRLAFSADTALDRAALRRYVCDLYLRSPNRYHLFVYVWGRLIRTSLVRAHGKAFDEGLRMYEDVAFNFSLLPHVERLNFLATPILDKYVDKHDGHAIGKTLSRESGWKHFGYVEAFRRIAEYVAGAGGEDASADAERLNIAFTVYTIITLIRLCGHAGRRNWRDILVLIRRILDDERLRAGLRVYRPRKGDSALIPLLLRLRLPVPLLLTCGVKSRLRYR